MMAWSDIKEVRDLEPYAKGNNYPMVIALCISIDGTFAVNSYGQTKQLCDVAFNIATQVFELMKNGTIEPGG